jgi:hypothetical protein
MERLTHITGVPLAGSEETSGVEGEHATARQGKLLERRGSGADTSSAPRWVVIG